MPVEIGIGLLLERRAVDDQVVRRPLERPIQPADERLQHPGQAVDDSVHFDGKIDLQPDRVHIDQIRVLDNQRSPLTLTGGAIGQGIPVAVGAAVASPGRKVISLNGDGASYENAWNGFDAVDWGALSKNDPPATLWVCGALGCAAITVALGVTVPSVPRENGSGYPGF